MYVVAIRHVVYVVTIDHVVYVVTIRHDTYFVTIRHVVYMLTRFGATVVESESRRASPEGCGCVPRFLYCLLDEASGRRGAGVCGGGRVSPNKHRPP